MFDATRKAAPSMSAIRIQRAKFPSALAAAGFRNGPFIIWVKKSLVLGRRDYHWRHEPILVGSQERRIDGMVGVTKTPFGKHQSSP